MTERIWILFLKIENMAGQITSSKDHVQCISNRAHFGKCKFDSPGHLSPCKSSLISQCSFIHSESITKDQPEALQRAPSGEEQSAVLSPEHFRENRGKWVGDLSSLFPGLSSRHVCGSESHRTKEARRWRAGLGGQSQPQGSLLEFVLNA